jgi:2'-5' RNA ligase
MYKDPLVWDRINSFALVTYIPEPLAGFLDRLRQELVPNCFLKAHATVLPPRPLSAPAESAWKVICKLAREFPPFDIQLGDIDVFPVSDVIHIQIAGGSDQLKRMHAAMNVEALQFREEFPYHPHITLAQQLKSDEVDELVHVARARWAECACPKFFRADKVVFVQSTKHKEWLDLGECELGNGESKQVGELTDLLVG